MILMVSDRADSYIQFLTILIIFVFVLAVTYWVTKWTAGYQKSKTVGANMEMIETLRLTNNKYVQIIRVGQKYLAVAVCKDTVTMLAEIPADELCLSEGEGSKVSSFRDVLARVQKGNFLEKEDGRDE
ncbi:MAG: flagellar biosynthetic protein FliO [Lachnospiraceae bacterium]|nr:flagellar biosynthetic protein FliO [Lachnospiraceae bacterium]